MSDHSKTALYVNALVIGVYYGARQALAPQLFVSEDMVTEADQPLVRETVRSLGMSNMTLGSLLALAAWKGTRTDRRIVSGPLAVLSLMSVHDEQLWDDCQRICTVCPCMQIHCATPSRQDVKSDQARTGESHHTVFHLWGEYNAIDATRTMNNVDNVCNVRRLALLQLHSNCSSFHSPTALTVPVGPALTSPVRSSSL